MGLTLKQRIIKFLTPVLFPLIRVYWKVWKPHTYGSKVIIRSGDRYLLVRNAYGRKNWTFPGGRIEKGEQAQDAAVREVLEEVGIEVDGVVFVGEIISRVEGKYDHVSVYVADVGEVAVVADPFEIEEHQWFREEMFPEIGPVAQMMWEEFKKKGV